MKLENLNNTIDKVVIVDYVYFGSASQQASGILMSLYNVIGTIITAYIDNDSISLGLTGW